MLGRIFVTLRVVFIHTVVLARACACVSVCVFARVYVCVRQRVFVFLLSSVGVCVCPHSVTYTKHCFLGSCCHNVTGGCVRDVTSTRWERHPRAPPSTHVLMHPPRHTFLYTYIHIMTSCTYTRADKQMHTNVHAYKYTDMHIQTPTYIQMW